MNILQFNSSIYIGLNKEEIFMITLEFEKKIFYFRILTVFNLYSDAFSKAYEIKHSIKFYMKNLNIK